MIYRKDSYEEIARSLSFKHIQPIVFTNGCFDIIHRGHIKVLHTCHSMRSTHGVVVVGINSDESIRRLKGSSRPIMDFETRVNVLMAIRYVDFVVSFDEDTPKELLDALNPHHVVKGGDYKPLDIIRSERASVTIVPFVDGQSTTKMIEKIRSRV